jgi:translation initiation factor IF-3
LGCLFNLFNFYIFIVQQSLEKSLRVNDQIKAKEVRVIDESGKMLGVMSVIQGIKLAEEAGLDLVEVSPNTEPPVCKIASFGKMKYELQKKAADSKKKTKGRRSQRNQDDNQHW